MHTYERLFIGGHRVLSAGGAAVEVVSRHSPMPRVIRLIFDDSNTVCLSGAVRAPQAASPSSTSPWTAGGQG